jgi:serine/threonine protein phosphatase 1
MKRIAIIGDVHGAIEQLELLHRMLQHYPLDAIEHCGDLIDRGPDPQGVVQFCRERNISGVLGNHESVILQYPLKGTIPKNPDKARSLEAITKDPRDLEYLRSLPYYKIHGDKLLHVHAGIHPHLPLQQQGLMFCKASLVHPNETEKVYWLGVDRKGISEEVHRKEGWFRWYEQYALPYDVVFGHMTFDQGPAFKHKALNGKSLYGVDTGGWFTKNLTALIYPDEIFVSTLLGEYRLD